MARSNTATSSFDDDDDELTTVLNQKAVLPAPDPASLPREGRRAPGSPGSRRAPVLEASAPPPAIEAATRAPATREPDAVAPRSSARPGPTVRAMPAAALPLRVARVPPPRPVPAAPRPPILVPTVLGALGVVFTLGMLIGRIPHAPRAQPVDVAAPGDTSAPPAAATAEVTPEEAAPADGARTVDARPDAPDPGRTTVPAQVMLAPITAPFPVRRPSHTTKGERGQVVFAVQRRSGEKPRAGSSTPGAPRPRPSADAPAAASDRKSEDARWASAADELARGQLEAALR